VGLHRHAHGGVAISQHTTRETSATYHLATPPLKEEGGNTTEDYAGIPPPGQRERRVTVTTEERVSQRRRYQVDGALLRRLRKERGLTQKELSKVSGVTAPSICRIERGGRSFTRLGTLQKLAHALDVEETDLIMRDPEAGLPEPTIGPELAAEIASMFDMLRHDDSTARGGLGSEVENAIGDFGTLTLTEMRDALETAERFFRAIYELSAEVLGDPITMVAVLDAQHRVEAALARVQEES
jgi:transcriptional regulator with XRE-family HTH domain